MSVVLELAQWLDTFPWTHVGHFTFKDRPIVGRRSPLPMRKRAIQYVQWVLNLCCRASERQHPQRCALAMAFVGEEFHKTGERIHLHALISAPSVQSSQIWRWWYRRFGRAVVTPYYRYGGAAQYVSKYCAKETVERGTWALLDAQYPREEAPKKNLPISTKIRLLRRALRVH